MRLRQVLWRRRWVLLLAAMTSAGAAIPSLMNAPQGFTSQVQVFIAPIEPIELGVRSVTPLALAIGAYGSDDLRADLRAELEADAHRIQSIEVIQDNRDEGLRTITVETTARDVATNAARIGGQLLVGEARRLGLEQLEELRANVAAQLEDLRRRRFEGAQDLAEAVASGVSKSQRADIVSDLYMIRAQRQGLLKLIEQATGQLAIRNAATRTVGSASPPKSDFGARLIETVGLALVVGVVVATLSLLWLERRSLGPARPAVGDSTVGRAGRGMFRTGTPPTRADDHETRDLGADDDEEPAVTRGSRR
jgi:hypothetical protein